MRLDLPVDDEDEAIIFQKDFTLVVLDEEQRSRFASLFYAKKKRQDTIVFQKEGNKSSDLIWMKKREEGFMEKNWTKKREEEGRIDKKA